MLFTIWTALVSLLILIVGFRTGGALAGIFVLIIIVPIYVLLTLGVYRVVLEAFMVVFRIYEETKKISERTQSQGLTQRIYTRPVVHSRRRDCPQRILRACTG